MCYTFFCTFFSVLLLDVKQVHVQHFTSINFLYFSWSSFNLMFNLIFHEFFVFICEVISNLFVFSLIIWQYVFYFMSFGDFGILELYWLCIKILNIVKLIIYTNNTFYIYQTSIFCNDWSNICYRFTSNRIIECAIHWWIQCPSTKKKL